MGQKRWSKGCEGDSTLGFCTVLKGTIWTNVHFHCATRCDCDSISFLERRRNPTKMWAIPQLLLSYNVYHQKWSLQNLRGCEKSECRDGIPDFDRFNLYVKSQRMTTSRVDEKCLLRAWPVWGCPQKLSFNIQSMNDCIPGFQSRKVRNPTRAVN